jgi:photosystem II stability/assembly factor-like uncharacterized protein
MNRILCCTILLLWANTAFSQDWTWKPSNGPYGGPIYALVANAQETYFAGTETRGVFVSDDKGASWKQTSLAGMGIVDLAVDSLDALYAASGDQLYRSMDAGVSWTGILPQGVPIAPTCLAVAPNQDILLGTATGFRWLKRDSLVWRSWTGPLSRVKAVGTTASGAWLVGTSSRMHRSTDNGVSWTVAESTFAPTAFCPATSDTILAGSDMEGFFISMDDGATWSARAEAPGKTITAILPGSMGDMMASVQYLDPSIPGGVIRSTDGGTTWIQWGLRYTPVNALISDSTGGILAGAYHGAFSSTGADSVWVPKNEGLTNVSVSALKAASASEVLAGSDVGMFYSQDAGGSWVNCFPDLSTGAVHALTSFGSERIFFSTMMFSPLGGIFRSQDHGLSWDHISGTTITGMYISIRGLLVTRDSILLAGTSQGRVYRSEDWGDSWTRVDSAGSTGPVEAIAADSAGRIFIASSTKGVFASTTKGLTWIDRSAGLKSKKVKCLAARDSAWIFAGGATGSLSRSSDAGLTWQTLSPGATGWVQALTVTPAGDIIASIGTRVLRSTDNGDTWAPDSSGLPATTIMTLAVTADSVAYAGADRQPVFYSRRTLTAIPDIASRIPDRARLEQNYPNPFNPSTTIRFTLGARVRVRLSVWNMLGQRVAMLRDEEVDPGQHECVFSGAGLASGVYFYQLQAGQFSEARRFLLLR